MKKIYWSLGGFGALVIPVASVVSCAKSIVNGVAFTKSNNTLNFSLNVPNRGTKFVPYFEGGNFSASKLAKLATDIDTAMTSNNVLKTKAGEKLELGVTILFTIEQPPDKNNLKNYKQEYRFLQKVQLQMAPVAANSDLAKKPLSLKNNIVLKLLDGLAKAGLISGHSRVTEQDVIALAQGTKTLNLIQTSTIAAPVATLIALAKKIEDKAQIPPVVV